MDVMTGYQRKGTVFKLVFEDPEMDGLIVRARNPSMGEMFAVMDFQSLAVTGTDGKGVSSQNVTRLKEMFEFFGKFLVEWNLENENGDSVPCDVQGLLSQDPKFVFSIVTAWLGVVGRVTNPLGGRSNGGPPLEVGSIPTETLSASLLNLPERS